MTVDCARDPVAGATINLIGSLNIFEAAIAEGLPGLAYVSTAGVFGPADSRHPTPATHYGAFKLAVEGSARAYLADRGFPSVGSALHRLRPRRVQRHRRRPEHRAPRRLRGPPATIRFSGRVGFVHVEEVAAAFVAATERPSAGADVLRLAGETADMADFVAALRAEAPGADVAIDGPPLRIPPEIGAGPAPAAPRRRCRRSASPTASPEPSPTTATHGDPDGRDPRTARPASTSSSAIRSAR